MEMQNLATIVHYKNEAYANLTDERKKLLLEHWRDTFGVRAILGVWRGNKTKYYAEVNRLGLEQAPRDGSKVRAKQISEVTKGQQEVASGSAASAESLTMESVMQTHGVDNRAEAEQLVQQDMKKVDVMLYEELGELGQKFLFNGVLNGLEIARDLRRLADMLEIENRTFNCAYDIKQVISLDDKRMANR